jgi:outer membrane murein-binding lipoprotein Lpp
MMKRAVKTLRRPAGFVVLAVTLIFMTGCADDGKGNQESAQKQELSKAEDFLIQAFSSASSGWCAQYDGTTYDKNARIVLGFILSSTTQGFAELLEEKPKAEYNDVFGRGKVPITTYARDQIGDLVTCGNQGARRADQLADAANIAPVP